MTPTILLAICLVLSFLTPPAGFAADPAIPVELENSDEFFPDAIGSSWDYRGKVVKTPLQTVETNRFRNTSTVTGTDALHGVEVKVFRDTNPGNHGPSDSYYRRDAAGIVYYGSKPGTELEQQVVPYQVVTFPLTYPSSFRQFDREDLDFGLDLDGDGVKETSDLAASVSVVGVEEVTVPAGTYDEVLRVEARMKIRIHLTKSGRVASGQDIMMAWFARGVGLIKYVERQELPAIRTGRARLTEITEQLEGFALNVRQASRAGSESSAQGVLADDARHHELNQVVVPAGLGSHP